MESSVLEISQIPVEVYAIGKCTQYHGSDFVINELTQMCGSARNENQKINDVSTQPHKKRMFCASD